jgi:hypothetical protein
MTIKMLKTYAGPLGLFVGGMNLDVADATGKKLIDGGYAQRYASQDPFPRLNKGKKGRK